MIFILFYQMLMMFSNELKKNINNLIEQDDTPEIPFISLKREKEKELGRKLTIQEFRELIKEK